MKIFITILFTMFIGACIGDTSSDKSAKSSNTSTVTVDPTAKARAPLPFSPPGSKPSTTKLDKEEKHEVPTINVTPESQSNNSSSGAQVPEKE